MLLRAWMMQLWMSVVSDTVPEGGVEMRCVGPSSHENFGLGRGWQDISK